MRIRLLTVGMGLVVLGVAAGCGRAASTGTPAAPSGATNAGEADSSSSPPLTPLPVSQPAGGATKVQAGSLPALDGPAQLWRYPANPKPDLAVIASLARALGVTGSVEASADGDGWQVGPDGGPLLRVRNDASLSWWYSATGADVPVACTVEPVPPDAPASGSSSGATNGSSTAACAPNPPADTPSAAQARVTAERVLKAIGADPAFHAWGDRLDPAGLAVDAYLQVAHAGQRGGLSIVVGPKGPVTASGVLATAVPAGERDQLGTTVGLEHLEQGESLPWTGPAGVAPVAAVGSAPPATRTPARDTPTPAASPPVTQPVSGGTTNGSAPYRAEPVPGAMPADGSGGASGSSGSSGASTGSSGASTGSSGSSGSKSPGHVTPVPVPMPTCASQPSGSEVCAVPTTIPVTLDVTAAAPALLPMAAGDGSTWLVPVYRFVTSSGVTMATAAIDTSFIPTSGYKVPLTPR